MSDRRIYDWIVTQILCTPNASQVHIQAFHESVKGPSHKFYVSFPGSLFRPSHNSSLVDTTKSVVGTKSGTSFLLSQQSVLTELSSSTYLNLFNNQPNMGAYVAYSVSQLMHCAI
jgi:hypothetical protein